jgi:pyridoxamine 5'-phosphate oxidase
LKSLAERAFSTDPIQQFRSWFKAAEAAGVPEANAMTLATTTRGGRPSARMVLLKGVDERGFLFFTNYESRKGRELTRNPRAALIFYWREVHRQVRVTGRVSKLTAVESDAYFATRPVGSRVAAAASRQSTVIASRAVLEAKASSIAGRYPDTGPPRPINWGGYCVHPDEIEFWQRGPHRLHDRLRYRKARGHWVLERLAP